MQTNRTVARIYKSMDTVRYLGKSSAPFLSQDSFKRWVDLDLDSKLEISTYEIESAQSIFCNSGNVENFLDAHGKNIRAKVLIFGNNDVDFLDFPYFIPPTVRAIYLQNSQISDGFFRTLPIGIENIHFARNGLPHLFRSSYQVREKKDRFLAGPFGITHNERATLINFIKQLNSDCPVDLEDGRIEPRGYAKLSSSYRYILCPRGNGLDTHRFWESLYRGSLPVVIKSPWSQSIASLGIPLIEIENWSALLSVYDEIRKSNKVFVPSQIEGLWEDYWYRELSQLLK